MQSPETLKRALAADRFYGVFLLLAGALCAMAPAFGGSILAWAMSLAGLAGGCWLLLDRSPRGFLAAVGWVVLCLGLGLQLVWHADVSMEQLAFTLTAGFVLLGAAEIVFGLKRFRPHSAPRIMLVAAGAAAAAFGVALSLALPALPNWLAGAVLGVVFAGFGAAVLIGARRRKPRSA
jgi:uncharacterized membrane protein HdeD (DUF308 family)